MQLTDPVAEAAMDCDSSDSGSQSQDDGPDDASLDEMQAAEAAVIAEPENYEVHAALVAVLRKLKMTVRLKDARETFAAKFPMHEHLWLDWISDALAEASGGRIQYPEVLLLAQRALLDYNTASLWQQFLEVLLLSNANVYTDNSEAVAFRQAAWQAISVCGSDMSGGASLYEVLCDFECTNVQRLIEQHGATSDVAKNAAEVAHAVWEKRSSAALPGGEDVLRAYKKWNDALPDAGLRKPITDKLQKALKRAKDAVTLRSSFEERISNKQQPAEDLLSAYLQYLRFERSQNPQLPGRLRMLLERAVERFPCTVEIWQQLTDHLEQQAAAVAAHPQTLPELLTCYKRACKNCPWRGSFWAGRLRAIEFTWQAATARAANGPSGEVSGGGGVNSESSWAGHGQVYSEALQIGLEDEKSYWLVMSTRLCACARHDRPAVRTEGQQAVALISGYFPEAIDVHANVVDLWASLEARLGSPEEARALAWVPFLARPETQQRRDVHKKYGWWEVQWGSIEKLREFYEGLLSRKKNVLAIDQKVEVAQNWVSAEERFGAIMHEMQARRLLSTFRVEAQAAAAVTQNQEKKGQEKGGKRKRGEDKEQGAKKEPAGKGLEKDGQMSEKGKGKRSKHEEAAPSSSVAAGAHTAHNNDSEGKEEAEKVSVDVATCEQADGRTGSEAAKMKKKDKSSGAAVAGEGEAAGEQTEGAPVRVFTDKCTVFVQNLPEDVTEDDLKELFQDVKEARLPKTKKGRAYVEFTTDDQLQKALEVHDTTWRGGDVKLSVQRSAPPGRGGGQNIRGGRHGGRGGRGGRGRGRSRGGLGHQAPPSEHPHNRVGDTMVPRAVSKAEGAAHNADTGENSKEPKGNSDFKKLLGLS